MRRVSPYFRLVAIFGLLGFAALRYGTPAPGPLALEARATYARVLGEETPHPVGSAHDAQIRERLIAELRALGYQPEVIEGSSCGSSRGCARTRSVVARRQGREPGPAVWLNCHYDSVGAGPAVSDDGAGVSAGLEIARVLSTEPPHRRAIALLFNEGEEGGLMGAEALVRHREFLTDVHAIVNLEARGTDGPSLMFETSPGNSGLIDLYAKSIARPVTNSISYAVYKRLPNDTDLTVFKRAGLAGYGFAFIGGTARYHTPLDDLAHGDLGTLEHQIDNALSLVRTLADADLPRTGQDSFFFDVFALFVVRGSFLLIRILAVLSVVAVAIALRRPPWRSAAAFLVCIVACAAISAGLLALLRPPYPWVAHPFAIRALFIALPLALAATVRLKADPWDGAWAFQALAGVAVAFAAPEVSYVLVIPSLAAGLFWRWRIVPIAVACVMVLPTAWLLYDAMGTALLPVTATLFAILFALAVPADRRLALASAGASVLFALAAAVMPPFTPDNPKHENVVLLVDEGQARWAVEGSATLEPSFRKAAQFGDEPEAPLTWLPRYRAFVAPAPAFSFAPPRLDGARIEGGTLKATLVSPRGAPRAGIVAPGNRVRTIRLDGQDPAQLTSKNRIAMSPLAMPDMINLRWETMTPEGVPVEIDLQGDGPIEITLWDQSPGIPDEGKPLLAARPKEACPVQDGDRTVVVRRTVLSGPRATP
jgi:hypothetical protein